MKRVTVTDSAAGHAVGWNPDASQSHFTIMEPAVLNRDTSYISIALSSGGNCHVETPQSVGEFEFGCSVGPPNGAELQYIVINLLPSWRV
jgi:hypothetical protein